jgi:hypothetical protein
MLERHREGAVDPLHRLHQPSGEKRCGIDVGESSSGGIQGEEGPLALGRRLAPGASQRSHRGSAQGVTDDVHGA